MLKLQDAYDVSVDIIGGKAYRLARMLYRGFPVKPAIILTVAEIFEILKTDHVPYQVREFAETHLNSSKGLAVRSSAVGEDGKYSWAGQFVTKLFVTLEELPQAILECARSATSAGPKHYGQHLNTDSYGMAVLIQEMVDAVCAGVLFTRHPHTNHPKRMVIEMVSGVGEGLVSGTEEPKRYFVHAESGEILEEEGNGQHRLEASHIKELVGYAQRLKHRFGEEQDVEWAVEKETGILWANQSRDITTKPTLQPDYSEKAIRQQVITVTAAVNDKEADRLAQMGCDLLPDIFSDQNIAELFPPFPTELGFGLFVYGFGHGEGGIRVARNQMGYEIGSELDTGFFRLIGGRPRCSIIHDAMTYRPAGIPLTDYCRIINYYLQEIIRDPKLASYPEVVLYNQRPSFEYLQAIFGSKGAEYYQAFHRVPEKIEQLALNLDRECREKFLPQWREKITAFWREDPKDLEAMVALFHKVADAFRSEACVMFVKAARVGFFAYAQLRRFLAQLFPEKGEEFLNKLTSGIPLKNNPNLSFGIALYDVKNGMRSLEEVLLQFGHLAGNELEIAIPRYREQPELLAHLAANITTDPRADFANSLADSIELHTTLQKEAGNAAEELMYKINLARTFLPLRELVKFEFVKAYEIMRRVAREIEQKLAWDSGLIFHLEPQELFGLIGQEDVLRAKAEVRRKNRHHYQVLHIPTVLSANHLEDIGHLETDETATVLNGYAATTYIVESTVVVVKSIHDTEAIKQLQPGCILVTSTTDPAWTPFLSLIGSHGGLITEVGGMLAHAAIYAREVGLAALLNVPNATTVLKTGQRVRINGPKNRVEILSS